MRAGPRRRFSWVEGIAAGPGQAWAVISYGGDRRICRFTAGAGSCEVTGVEAGNDAVDTQRIALAGGTVWIAANDGRLYRREEDGALTLASDGRIDELRALADGSIAFVRYDGFDGLSLHRIADGVDTVLAEDARLFIGNRLDRLFVINTEWQHDNSCGFRWSCSERLLWSQLTVLRVEERGAREVGHLDGEGGAALLPIGLVLPDGRALVRLEVGTFMTSE